MSIFHYMSNKVRMSRFREDCFPYHCQIVCVCRSCDIRVDVCYRSHGFTVRYLLTSKFHSIKIE
jgi:hypothetical protein